MPKRYRKRQGEVEAVQWDGSSKSQSKIVTWSGGRIAGMFDSAYYLRVPHHDEEERADPGDWIVREGEVFSVYEPDIFQATYEPVEGGEADQAELVAALRELAEDEITGGMMLTRDGQLVPINSLLTRAANAIEQSPEPVEEEGPGAQLEREVAEAEEIVSWRCECGDLNRGHEACCYRCGAGKPETRDEAEAYIVAAHRKEAR